MGKGGRAAVARDGPSWYSGTAQSLGRRGRTRDGSWTVAGRSWLEIEGRRPLSSFCCRFSATLNKLRDAGTERDVWVKTVQSKRGRGGLRGRKSVSHAGIQCIYFHFRVPSATIYLVIVVEEKFLALIIC